MIKITPKVGKPYYLVDDRGDGKFARQESLDSGVRPPRWVILIRISNIMAVFTSVTEAELPHGWAIIRSAACLNCRASLRALKTPITSSPPVMGVLC